MIDLRRRRGRLVSINDRGPSFLGICEDLSVECLLAERAIVVILAPLLDAIRVEIVALVAGQGRDHVSLLEWQQADDALLVLAEFRPVEYARKLAQIGGCILALESVSVVIGLLIALFLASYGSSLAAANHD